MLRVLDLFSGIGGFSLGLQMAGGFQTVQFVEIEPFCQQVLAKNFPGIPIHADIRTFQPAAGSADLVCGGFPCQPFSHAGQRRGKADDRDLWPEMRRVIEAVRPAWVIGENVAGFIQMELDRSLADLEALGYTTQSIVIPACAVAAPHRRDRVWIVAHSAASGLRDVANTNSGRRRGAGERQSEQPGRAEAIGASAVGDPAGAGRDATRSAGEAISESIKEQRSAGPSGRSGTRTLADADQPRPQGHRGLRERAGERTIGSGRRPDSCEWQPEPAVGRVAHGIPRRVDRLRGLGNAVVPQVVAEIGRAISEVQQ